MIKNGVFYENMEDPLIERKLVNIYTFLISFQHVFLMQFVDLKKYFQSGNIIPNNVCSAYKQGEKCIQGYQMKKLVLFFVKH